MTDKLPENHTDLPEPVAPEEWECCGSECGDACVWQLYAAEKAAYEAQQRARQTENSGSLNPKSENV